MSDYTRVEIARTGLWSVCYMFKHLQPPGHTDPYCADFADDNYPVEGLTSIQMLCLLSVCLSCFGSALLGFVRLLRLKSRTFSSAAFIFLAMSGMCGLAGCLCIHLYLTKESLVCYDTDLILYKWWAFHAFLDGSIVNLATWFTNGSFSTRFRSIY